ncbi:MAG: NosD domain-containing protein [Candidatus Thorarchaeota archaeon]
MGPRRKVIVGLMVFLIATAAFLHQVAAPDILNPEEHEPIFINGNEDLVATATEEGWSGTGAESSPIIIKGLSIASETHGIHILNVNLHFRIEECLITETEIGMYQSFGIRLENCSEASIENCIIWNNEFGICLTNSDGAYVYRTEIYESVFGVFVNKSSGVWIHSLDIIVCKVGIRFNESRYAYVDQTIVDHCEYSGIEGIYDYGTLLRHNSIIGSETGVQMDFTENWVIEESWIESCEVCVDACYSTGGYVLRTMVKNCSMIGIDLKHDTTNVTILECWLGPNNALNAQDDGNGNMWCDELQQIGNYWSDYTGEGTYTIPGSAESVDLYPTSLEDAPSWEDVVIIDSGPTDNGGTTDDNPFDEPTLIVAIASVVVILLVAVAMLRSRVSPGAG